MRVIPFFLLFCAGPLWASPFSMEMDVSSGENLNRMEGVSADYSVLVPEETPSVVSPALVSPEVPVVPVVKAPTPPPLRLSLPMPLAVGAEKPVPVDSTVRFLASKSDRGPLLKAAVSPGALPPLAKDLDATALLALEVGLGSSKVPSGSGTSRGVPTSSVLVSRDGEFISGEDAMVDYMLSKALPARPAVRPVENDLISSLGAPGDAPAVSTSALRKVDTDVVGEITPGVAFGVQPSVPLGVSGFDPLPPQAYTRAPVGVSDASVPVPVPASAPAFAVQPPEVEGNLLLPATTGSSEGVLPGQTW